MIAFFILGLLWDLLSSAVSRAIRLRKKQAVRMLNTNIIVKNITSVDQAKITYGMNILDSGETVQYLPSIITNAESEKDSVPNSMDAIHDTTMDGIIMYHFSLWLSYLMKL